MCTWQPQCRELWESSGRALGELWESLGKLPTGGVPEVRLVQRRRPYSTTTEQLQNNLQNNSPLLEDLHMRADLKRRI